MEIRQVINSFISSSEESCPEEACTSSRPNSSKETGLELERYAKNQQDILVNGSVEAADKLMQDAKQGLVKLEWDYPLLETIYNPNPDVTRLLIEKYQYDPNVNASSCDFDFPLKQAAYYGNFEVIKLLIEKGADITNTDHNNEYLMNWVTHNHTDKELASKLKPWLDDYLARQNPRLAQRLQDNLEQMRLEDRRRSRVARNVTILTQGNCKQIKKLINRGLDTIELEAGCHILHIAAKNPDPEVMIMLLEKYHFSPNVIDDSRLTPLMYAVRWAKNPAVIKVLIEHGAKAQGKDQPINNCKETKPNDDYIDVYGHDLIHYLRGHNHHSWIPDVEQWVKNFQQQPKNEIHQANNKSTKFHHRLNNNSADFLASPLETSPSDLKTSSVAKWFSSIFCNKKSHRINNDTKHEKTELIPKAKIS